MGCRLLAAEKLRSVIHIEVNEKMNFSQLSLTHIYCRIEKKLTIWLVIYFFQSPSYDFDISGAEHMRSRSDNRLVRFPRRMSSLERSQTTEAPRRVERPDALLEQRHPRFSRSGQLGPDNRARNEK